LIDLQSLGNDTYRFLCTYQDHGIKDVYLHPLRGKTMREVAQNLLRTFAIIGVPLIIHTDNGKEFASLANMPQQPISNDEMDELIGHIRDLWPDAIMVKGRPRHSESQGGIERANRLVQKRLGAWMRSNGNKNWPLGCPFVQWGINTSYHSGIKNTPYELRFGQLPTCGLSMLPLSDKMKAELRDESELLEALPVDMRNLLTSEDVFKPGGEYQDTDPRPSDGAASQSNNATSDASQSDNATSQSDSAAAAAAAGAAPATASGDVANDQTQAAWGRSQTYDDVQLPAPPAPPEEHIWLDALGEEQSQLPHIATNQLHLCSPCWLSTIV
jgi:hypothetical protein